MSFELKEESHTIIGCSMEVHRVLGPGLTEKPYENALVVEFGLQEVSFEQQKRFDVNYKGVDVEAHVPDLIAVGRIVIETKAISEITDREVGQMLTYFRVSGLPVGLIINFSPPSLQRKRVVLACTKSSSSEINLR